MTVRKIVLIALACFLASPSVLANDYDRNDRELRQHFNDLAQRRALEAIARELRTQSRQPFEYQRRSTAPIPAPYLPGAPCIYDGAPVDCH
jgi:hypothetical protein